MKSSYNCPSNRKRVIDLYFLEHRAKLLDIASFLDRIQRADPLEEKEDNFRLKALKNALHLLIDDEPNKTKRILESLSDQDSEVPQSALGTKGAMGAPKEIKK